MKLLKQSTLIVLLVLLSDSSIRHLNTKRSVVNAPIFLKFRVIQKLKLTTGAGPILIIHN
jgi:hypothetical protein